MLTISVFTAIIPVVGILLLRKLMIRQIKPYFVYSLMLVSIIMGIGIAAFLGASYPQNKDVFYLEQLKVDKISGESLKRFYLVLGNIGYPGKLGFSFRYKYGSEHVAGTVPLNDSRIVEISDPLQVRLEVLSSFINWYGFYLGKNNIFYIPKE
jgi:hypothetical protein